ncbi:LytR/AlgR family response regulator transcription factor [Croceiramulus getboli]|nr:LytTR family DNA-binding domain-containing protein [Flavobacteriaceae bacterium YJPT1-3]
MSTVLIIDDEEDARTLVKQYLSDFSDFSVIGEAVDGLEAVQLINQWRPDLIFLDIQMPGLNGFEVLTKIKVLPDIIFSTAFDDYALDAFKVQAMDYLLKPYGKKRFDLAMSKLESNGEKVQRLAEKLLAQRSQSLQKMIAHKGNKRLIIDAQQIVYLEAYGDYTKVFTQRESLLSTSGLALTLEKLDPTHFMRIHRSYAINLNHVNYLMREGRYHYIEMNSSNRLKVSPTYLDALKAIRL